MKKRNKMIMWFGLGIVILVLLVVFYLFNNISITNNTSMITARLYDKDGKLIVNPSMSIVDGVPGVYYIDLSVAARNTGQQALSCNLKDVSPAEFDSAIVKVEKGVLVNQKAGWTTTLIPVAAFETRTQPTVFTASIECSYNAGSQNIMLPVKTGTLPLNILSDITNAAFEVELSRGGIGTEYCGDNICQSSETSSTCPSDCAIIQNVKFRTTDITYPSGSAIAFSNSCGDILDKYGHTTKYGSGSGCYSSSGTCDTGISGCSQCPSATKKFIVPAVVGADIHSLWTTSTAGTVCICATQADGTGWYVIKYTTGDSDASKVDNSFTSIDAIKEVSCIV